MICSTNNTNSILSKYLPGTFRSFVNYETKFFFKVSLPFIAGSVVGVIILVAYLLENLCNLARFVLSDAYRRSLDAKKLTSEQKIPRFTVAVSVTMTLVYFLYLTVCRAAFDILNCQTTIPSTGIYYMASRPLEKCYVEGSMQSRLSPIAITVIIVYGIGFPGGIFLAFYFLRNRIKEDQWLRVHGLGDSYARNKNLSLRKSCGQMYRMYQPRFYLWSTLILIRKLLLCAIAVMFRDNPTYQMASTLSLMFAAFIMQVKAKPYLDSKEKAHLMRQEAESKILAEILRLERQSMLVRASGDSYAKLLHQMRSQIDEQDKIISQHRQDFLNLNTVELVLLASAVILCKLQNVHYVYLL